MVIIGYGRVGKHLVNVLRTLAIPQLVIESDAERVQTLNEAGIPTLYGDAANSEVITHAGLDKARALVVTVPEESPAAANACPYSLLAIRHSLFAARWVIRFLGSD